MRFSLQRYSYRFGGQVLNSNIAIKQEIEGVLTNLTRDIKTPSRPQFNLPLRDAFVATGWGDDPHNNTFNPTTK